MSSGAVGKAIGNIHKNARAVLKYIIDNKKTDNQYLVEGINCLSSYNAKKTANEFKNVYNRFAKNENMTDKSIVAHHYLISFDPKDNIEPNKAMELSKEIMNRFLKEQHQCVLATHVDKKDHIHTHIVFNTYNKFTGKKYESSPQKLKEFKEKINEVCLENNLQLINKNKSKNKDLHYKEWLEKNNIIDDTKIERFKYIRKAVESVLKDKNINSLEKLSNILKEKYNLDMIYKSAITDKIHKNITFKADSWNKAIRGKYDVSLESIIDRLENRQVENNKFEQYCIENNTTDYKKYIKSSIDHELENNISITKADDLAEILKEKYNIEMRYLSVAGEYLKNFKFKALDSSQKNFVGAGSLDKENKNKYELKGINSRISEKQKIEFGVDIRKNLEILNSNLLINGKTDKWGITTGLEYMTKLNLRSKNDIYIRNSRLANVKNTNEVNIDKIDKYLIQMDSTYKNLKNKMIKIESLQQELSGLGVFNLKQKKELTHKINEITQDINILKESEHYQKDIKYSEKQSNLNMEREKNIETLKKCEFELDILNKIGQIEANKEGILSEIKQKEKNEVTKDVIKDDNFRKDIIEQNRRKALYKDKDIER